MKIFFDLDGTLIDSRMRLYKLFCKLVPASTLSFEQYWKLKRQKINHEMILSDQHGFDQTQIADFNERWMELIEDMEWLKLDVPFEGITDYLRQLKQNGISLFIVTARQFKARVSQQISSFGWDDLFESVLVTEQKYEKVNLMEAYVDVNSQEKAYMVGDTGKDIMTGKQLNMQTVAVLSGFLNKEKLLQYEPDIILDRVTKLDIISI